MNGDEVVGHTLYLFCSSCNPDHEMCVDKALPVDVLDVRFALLTVNESRRICSNYKLMGENLNMH
jgi:hypothetical protein